MFECKTCIRRFARTIFADILNAYRSSSHIPLLRHQAQHASRLRRGYASEAILFDDAPTPSPTLDVGVRNPYVPRPSHPAKEDEPFSLSNLGREVRWLKDPLKLGDHIVKLLRQNDAQKALEIVRLASKNAECTVSWNYMIDYHMSKGDVKGAVKLYNEMKKRAQQPDAHTFTTLFRGFSWNPKHSLSRSKTLSIYHSMFAEKSPVRPSIIHTNAVLKFCALSGDIDALLGVAAKLPSQGKGAPDNLTFTTILNAIRNDTLKAIQQEKMDQAKQTNQHRAVMQGRRLWNEIRERWAKGDLLMDEKLVCAMGRLLLVGDEEIILDDILSLVEQTMGIPRQVPRVGEPGRKAAQRNLQEDDDSKDSTQLDGLAPFSSKVVSESEDPYNSNGDPFAILANGLPKSRNPIPPGPNTLSLVLEACIRLRLIRAAQNYWGLLTDPSGPYRIQPDTENYHMYLRLLRTQRASRLTVCLIIDMSQGALGPKITLLPKTFRIGLSCCVRDKKNTNSIHNAAKLVSLMNARLEHPDAQALQMYLTLGLSQEPRDWRTLMGIVREVELGIRNLRGLLAYDPKKGRAHTEDIMRLVRTTRGAFDVILDIGNEEMSEQDRKHCNEQKYTFSAWITRMANQDRAIKDSESGRTSFKIRRQGQANAEFDEIDGVHGNVDARGIASGAFAPQVADDERQPIRWRTRRSTQKDVAPSWNRFTSA